MTTERETPVEERLAALLDHLGIERAHFAGRTVGEMERLCLARPEAVSSLTLVNARLQRGLGVAGLDVLRAHADRLLAFFALSPTPASERLREAISEMAGAQLVAFPEGYDALGWHDIAAERTDELATTMRELMLRAEESHPATSLALPATDGEVDGISYSVLGEGPVLLLFPLSLAHSQWTPLLPRLSGQFTTVVVGGRHVGLAAFLEARAQLQGYQRVVRTMLAEVELQPGERVLELGCGTGALVRDLARRTDGANPITALDHNEYLLKEAEALARAEGLDGAIEFREGDAEALPIADDAYDVTFSSTLIGEGNADRMMAEHVRVTRPGGRVAITARALDLPHTLNLDVPDAVRRKVAAPRVGGGLAAGGCADASLYDRFVQSGLTDIRMMPMWGPTSPPPDYWVDSCMHLLTPEEGEAFQAALREGIEAGTAFGGPVYHVAVGTKP
jgi:SAM-dependent methyltransferase